MTRRVAIINRSSWRRCDARQAGRWLAILQNDFGTEPLFTDYPGHAAELARASRDADLIIASGGDGTVHEIVNAMDLGRQSLAIVPIGTGNGLCRDLGIGPAERALRLLARGPTRRIDLIRYRLIGEAGEVVRYGVSTSGIGFICDVVSLANRRMKKYGALCYPLATAVAVWTGRPVRAAVEVDGRDIGMRRITNLILNNGQYAGNFCLFPRALTDDASFHLLAADIHPAMQFFHTASIFTRAYIVKVGIETRASRLRIRAEDGPFSFMIDGEVYPAVREVACALEPGRLTVVG